MFRKSHSSCYRSHVNSTDNILFSKPHQYENNNLKIPYIVHAAIEEEKGDNRFTNSVTFDSSREKCTCEQLNFCEIHTVSNKINNSLDYSNEIESTYTDISSITQIKDVIQLEKEMKLHHGIKISPEVSNRRRCDYKQYLFDNDDKNNTIALELIPIMNISDNTHADYKQRDYHLSTNFEINKSTNALTHQNAITANPSAKPIYTKSKGTIYHKNLPLPKCQCGIDGVSNIYRSLMGPTPDESILAGLQTVYDVCNNKGTPKKQNDRKISIGSAKSSTQKEMSGSGTYMNYSTICVTPTIQNKHDYSTYKDQVKFSFNPSLNHSSSSFNTCSLELENGSINSFSRELSYEFQTLNKNKNRRCATLKPCHFNPMQVTPTMINICDRICFSEASIATDVTASSNSVDKSNNRIKTSKKSQEKNNKKNKNSSKKSGKSNSPRNDSKDSKSDESSKSSNKKNSSKKSGKSNSPRNDSKDSKSDKSSKSTKSNSNKKLKVKKLKGTKTTKNSKLSTQNKNSKLSKKNKGSNKAATTLPKKKIEITTKNISSSNESDVLLSKKSMQIIACDDPGNDVITIPEGKIKLAGPCYPGICGANLSTSAAGILPKEIRYAIAKISRFHDYTTYEIMKSSERKPSKIPVCTEGVFILQNKTEEQ